MNKGYIEVPRLFEGHIALAQRFVAIDSERYTHTLDVSDSDLDVIRVLPWLDELVVSKGLVYDPFPSFSEKTLFGAYYVRNNFLADEELLKKIVRDGRLLIILGEPGSGKTTFINYLYRHSKELQKYRETHYIILITCNKDYQLISRNLDTRLNLAEFVSIQLSEALNNLAARYGCTEEDIFEDIGRRALAKGIKEAMERARGGDAMPLIEPKIYRHLLEGHGYNKRVFEWFERNHPELTIDIVVDNLDCFPRLERNEAVSKILHMCRQKNTKIILPLRYSTFIEYDHRDAMSQWAEALVKVPLKSPGFKNILNKRLTNLPPKLTVKDRALWAARMKRISSGLCSSDIVDLFNGVFGGDTREKLKGIKTVLDSHFLINPDAYKDRTNILKALMLGECYIALPKFTHLHNLFYNHDSPGFQNTLVQIRVLQFVSAYDPLVIDPDGYISKLVAAGYDKRGIKNAINYLLRSNLIYVKDFDGLERLPMKMSDETRLRLTDLGDYYLNVLLDDPIYVALSAQASYVPKSITRICDGEYLVDVVKDYIRKEKDVNSLLGGIAEKNDVEVFVSLKNFVEYIRSEEKEEAEKSSNSLEGYCISDNLYRVSCEYEKRRCS